MPEFGLTADGFVAKTLEDIEAGIVAQQRANIDPAIDTSQFELIGQLNGIFASELAELWKLAKDLHDALDPDKAVGAQQDALYSLTNTLREGQRKSTVIAFVTLQPGADIAVGEAQASVEDNPEAKFVNAEPMVNASIEVAEFEVRFESVDAGPVVANATKLTVIDATVPGWDSITNALDAEPGALVESDPAYRLRRVDELAAQGGGTAPGLRADLLQLSTVRDAVVLENPTNSEVDGLPPKSFEAVVRSVAEANDEDAIAQSIWGNKPAGMESFGSEPPVTIEDSEGEEHTIYFSRPTDADVYISLRLRTSAGYAGDELTKTALVAALEHPASPRYQDVGGDVYAGAIVAAVMSLPGVLNAGARVSLASIPDFDAAPQSLELGLREIAAFDSSRITISPFP